MSGDNQLVPDVGDVRTITLRKNRNLLFDLVFQPASALSATKSSSPPQIERQEEISPKKRVNLDRMYNELELIADARIQNRRRQLAAAEAAEIENIEEEAVASKSKSLNGTEDRSKSSRSLVQLRTASSLTSDSASVNSRRLIEVNKIPPSPESEDMRNAENFTDDSRYYVAMYAKPSNRKHKSMEDDGFLIVSGKSVTLKDSNGEVLATSFNTKLSDEMLTEQKIFNLGGKEVQILEKISNDPFGADSKFNSTEETIEQSNKKLKSDSSSGQFSFNGVSSISSRVKIERNEPTEVCSTNSVPAKMEPEQEMEHESKCYVAMYAKPSTRKRKVMEDDGYLIVSGKSVTLKDSNGEVLATSFNTKLSDEMLTEQKIFNLGGKEVQILEKISNDPFGADSKFNSTEETIEQSNKKLKSDSSSSGQFNSRVKIERSEPSTEDVCSTNSVPAKMEPEQEGQKVEHESKCYVAMYAKPSTRKHKVMEHDGFLIVSGKSAVLKNPDGGVVASVSSFKLSEEMVTGEKIFKFGSKEVQIMELTNNPFGEESNSEDSFRWNP